MTGTKTPLKIVPSNRTSPIHGRAVSPTSDSVSDRRCKYANSRYKDICDRNSAFFVGVLYGKYCGVWGFIPIHINIVGQLKNNNEEKIN